MSAYDQNLISLKRNQNEMDLLLSRTRDFINEQYKQNLSISSEYSIMHPDQCEAHQLRMVRVKKIVYGQEDIHMRLLSLFQVLHDTADSVFLMIRGSKQFGTELYLGLKAVNAPKMAGEALERSIHGNFPGTETENIDSTTIGRTLERLKADAAAVSAITGVPSRRSMVNSSEDSLNVQSLERFIDSMNGEEYTAIILAKPVSQDHALDRLHSMESISTAISPLEKLSYQYGENTSMSSQISVNRSIAENISKSVADGYNSSKTESKGRNRGSGSSSNGHFDSMGFGFSSQHGSFNSHAETLGTSKTLTETSGSTYTGSQGKTEGISLGMSESWTLSSRNRSISSLAEDIEKQIKRFRQCCTYGAWDTCAFFISDDPRSVRLAAANYQALITGEDSMTSFNLWYRGHEDKNPQHIEEVLASIISLEIPEYLYQGMPCQIGTMVSSAELSMLMNLPRKSVRGLPVIEMASFGQDTLDKTGCSPEKRAAEGILARKEIGTLPIGHVYHMGVDYSEAVIRLSCQMLCAHMLVCGMPGVGKSTLIAMMINALTNNIPEFHFMIVEPVKGEYKHLLGKAKDTEIFTLDPLTCRLLRINPFQFMDGIHILSHIDRLMDIFSVCWPLYAAQPAILRETIEDAYISCGWDLSNSVYVLDGQPRYPTFRNLSESLKRVIDRSRFVGEARGTYEGALLARIGMLSRGVYGEVFTDAGCIEDRDLFDRNVIIDLSSAGAQETVSLIMGILIIRLREYRTVTGNPDNALLKHIMVLEEAHNIFPRKDSKNAEGGETVGAKSVELLSQSIAEMRSFGQGFLIADQSPSAIDISAMRNTATKVFMRLTEAADQEAVAKTLSLNEQQARELTRLPEQVALVYQANWLEPVLIKVTNKEKTKLGAAYAEKVSADTMDQIKMLRGAVLHKALTILKGNTFSWDSVMDAIQKTQNVSEDRKKDYTALCRYYRGIYEEEIGPEAEQEEKEAFLAEFVQSLLSCKMFLELAPPPHEIGGITNEIASSAVTKARADKWRNRAKKMIDCYAANLTKEEKEIILYTILKAGSSKECMQLICALYADFLEKESGDKDD